MNINKYEKITLDTDALNPKTIIEGIDVSSIYDKWGFISVGCSKLTMYCEVHHGNFDNDYETFKSQVDRNGVYEYKYYHNDLLFWKPMPTCQISLTGPVESNKYHIFLKEFQVY